MLTAFFAALLVGGGLVLLAQQGAVAHEDSPTPSCFFTHDIAEAVAEGRCLVVFEGMVYDLTEAKKWSIEGHVDQHQCGGIYTKGVVEDGPHEIAVLEQYAVAPICGEGFDEARGKRQSTAVSDTQVAGSALLNLKRPFGLSWRVLFAYVSGVFFILNFLTCYAMPWARRGAPWAGKRPGEDERDPGGHFPLTHWHPWFAWGAVFFLALHGALGFLCVWGVACL